MFIDVQSKRYGKRRTSPPNEFAPIFVLAAGRRGREYPFIKPRQRRKRDKIPQSAVWD
jgi:hypothetical protein